MLALAMLVATGVAWADCPPARPVPVTLAVQDQPITQDVTQPFAELHRRTGVPVPNPAAAGAQLHLGLTTVRLSFAGESDFAFVADGEGVCARPTGVRLTMRHAEHHVMVAAEVPPGGCLFREVLAHEMRHVEVNRTTLAQHAPRVRESVARWAQTAMVRAADRQAAADALGRQLSAAARPALDALGEARRTGHAAIDTPIEYRRISTVCRADQVRLRARLRGLPAPE